MKIEQRYLDGSYLERNPDWDRQDAVWKATQATQLLAAHGVRPRTLCEVGCGSGDILRAIADHFPEARLVGYDVSPQLEVFWGGGAHAPSDHLRFVLGDFHTTNVERHDVLLMLDVFEHVRDPFTFLEESRSHASHFVFHIPLDLSALSVVRGTPLLDVRRSVGHLHFYTKDLALETLRDCGYAVVEWRYTGAALNGTSRGWRTRLAQWPRWLAYKIHRDLGVRLLGGETLLVLARPAP